MSSGMVVEWILSCAVNCQLLGINHTNKKKLKTLISVAVTQRICDNVVH